MKINIDKKFKEIEWNKVIIKGMNIKRQDENLDDKLCFYVNYSGKENVKIIFERVYWCEVKFDWSDSLTNKITNAEVISDPRNTEIKEWKRKWSAMWNTKNINVFEFTLQETKRKIKIVAANFYVVDE